MQRRRSFTLAACASLLGMVACSAIAGLDADFNDLSGEDSGLTTGPDARTNDAPSNQTDGQTPGTDAHKDPIDTDAGDGGTPGVDACVPRADAAVPPDNDDSHLGCGGFTGDFCWDFGKDAGPPTFGWNGFSNTASATVDFGGVVEKADHSIHMALAPSAAQDSGAALAWMDWNNPDTSASDDPIPLNPSGDKLRLEFSFKLTQQARAADLVTFAFENSVYGLSIYEDPCAGGPARIAPRGDDPFKTGGTGGAVVEDSKWYRSSMIFTFGADGTYTVAYRLGGASKIDIGSKSASFGAAKTTIKAVLKVGLFGLASGTKASEVLIDDVVLDRGP